MIGEITPDHHKQILKINARFVHWLSPLDETALHYILSMAAYKRQLGEAQGVLIGYPHDTNYPDHKNLVWLNGCINNFFYIERVIIDEASQGKGYGRRLYEDVEAFARSCGYMSLACEVNTRPDNPGSHKFHLSMGFTAIGEEDYPEYEASVRYYQKRLD